MKKTKGFVLILLLAFCTAACSGGAGCDKQTTEPVESGMKIGTEIPAEYPSELPCYLLDYAHLDEETIVQELLPPDAKKTIQNIDDVTWESGDGSQYVKITFKTEDNDACGITWGSTEKEAASSYKDLASRVMMPNITSTIEYNEQMVPFEKEQEKAEEKREIIEQQLKTLCESISIPLISVRYLYYRDSETLSKNMNVYNRYFSQVLGTAYQPIEYEYTSADEDIIVWGTLELSGIPITGYEWRKVMRMDQAYVTPWLKFCFSTEGDLESIDISGLFNLKEKTETVKIASPEEAVRVYEDMYGKGGMLKKTTLRFIELDYAVLERDKELKAVPVWLLNTVTETDETNGYVQYDTTAIDAETLQILTQ